MPRTRRNPLLSAVLSKYAMDATVAAAEPATPTMQRIRLETDQPIPFAYSPGQHIRLEVKDPFSLSGILTPSDTLRTYTVWELAPDRRAIELRIHLYDGDGLGLNWARQARRGDQVAFWWPRSHFVTREADYHVFIGEETASAAFGPMIRALGLSARVYGVLEGEAPENDLPMPFPHRLRRVHRDGAPAASSQVLLSAVRALDLPEGVGAAYVAGEARTCQTARDILVREHGWPRTSIQVKPFWTPDKRGLH